MYSISSDWKLETQTCFNNLNVIHTLLHINYIKLCTECQFQNYENPKSTQIYEFSKVYLVMKTSPYFGLCLRRICFKLSPNKIKNFKIPNKEGHCFSLT